MTTLTDIQGAVARGWCHPANAHKEMDVSLATAIADEVYKVLLAEPAVPQAEPSDEDIRKVYQAACSYADRLQQGFSYGRTQALRAVFDIGRTFGSAPVAEPAASGAGKLGDGAHYRCRKCGEQNVIEFNSARILTHNRFTGKPRDQRDIDSDPEGKLIVDPGEPLLAAAAPPQPVGLTVQDVFARSMTTRYVDGRDQDQTTPASASCPMCGGRGHVGEPPMDCQFCKVHRLGEAYRQALAESPDARSSSPQPVAQGDYPPLPVSVNSYYDDIDREEVLCYSAGQMHAYLDADRAARSKREEVRKPLTKDQVDFILGDAFLAANGSVYSTRVYDFVKAIEREHGIAAAPTTSGGE